MRMLGATVTRPDEYLRHVSGDARSMAPAKDEQLAVSCIAGVVTLKLEDGTTVEVDEVQLSGALFFAANVDAA
jgi:hypothetical protein